MVRNLWSFRSSSVALYLLHPNKTLTFPLQLVRTLAMTTDPLQIDADFEEAFSDDSEVAMSIICSRRSVGPDIDMDGMALGYFESVSTLETLYLWVFGGSVSTFTTARDDDGIPTTIKPIFDEEDDSQLDKFEKTLDRDGFPKKLSFPCEILTHDSHYDPPTYGRSTKAEHESTARVSIQIFCHVCC
jgi:hypothetical protein